MKISALLWRVKKLQKLKKIQNQDDRSVILNWTDIKENKLWKEAVVITATVGHKFKRKCLKLSTAREVKRQICVDMKEVVERKMDGR